MITVQNLPPGYIAYKEIEWCSNTVRGGGHFATIGDDVPLLVGQGTPPIVWMQARDMPASGKYVTLVEASVPRVDSFRVISDGPSLTVTVGAVVVLHVTNLGGSRAKVDRLDLRPLGLLIEGGRTQLKVGGSVFKGNTVVGGTAFIGLQP